MSLDIVRPFSKGTKLSLVGARVKRHVHLSKYF